MPKVAALNIHPIKSTRPISLQEVEVESRGLRWDRRWMLVDGNRRFITPRQVPRLAMISTHFEEHQLVVSAPGQNSLRIPLSDPGKGTLEVGIWRDQCRVVPVGREADSWFSEFLGLECRLVRLSDQDHRAVDPAYGEPGDEVSLADGYPLLIIGEASLADLNRRLEAPVPMLRFRPNLVVDTEQPFVEDQWRRIRIGELEFELVKACSRCVFTTIDPETGVRHPKLEPLRTLGGYRRRSGGGVFFGQNAIPRGRGRLIVGLEVEILSLDEDYQQPS